MAKASIKTEKIPVTTYEEKKTVTLELSWDEARLLRTMIGDCSSSGAIEQHLTSIFHALKEVVSYDERFIVKYSSGNQVSYFMARGL